MKKAIKKVLSVILCAIVIVLSSVLNFHIVIFSILSAVAIICTTIYHIKLDERHWM